MFSKMMLVFVATLLIICLSSASAQYSVAQQNQDINVLQYALVLENLEATFYAQGLAMFNQNAFQAAGFNSTVYSFLQMIASHEASHVSFLNTAIASSGIASPLGACTYNFQALGFFTNVSTFFASAALLESTGVSAYTGALNSITNPVYAQAAATIATIEGRHASYLNTLIGSNPFPNTFDIPNNVTFTISQVAPLLNTCPYNITAAVALLSSIVVRPGGSALVGGSVVLTGPASSGPAIYTSAQATNDINVLQYALVLENLEASFYSYASSHITSIQWTTANYPLAAYNLIGLIGQQESTHASTLAQVITMRGGSPIPACTAYNFTSVNSPAAYLAIASVLEATGVEAYDGAAAMITDTNLQQVAATIATVEARHSSYLYALLNSSIAAGGPYSPFPQAFDTPLSPSAVVAAVMATGFLGTCPQVNALVLPQLLSTTSVKGDPLFTGFHGQRFQVHGISGRHFNLISTPTVQVSATFSYLDDGDSMTAGEQRQARLLREIKNNEPALPLTTAFSHAGTFLSHIAIKAGNTRIYLQAGAYKTGLAVAQMDRQDIAVSGLPIQIGDNVYLSHATPSVVRIETNEFSFEIVNSDYFFNIDSATLNTAIAADSQIEGLLGQTADADFKVEKSKAFSEHIALDYLIVGDIFSDDFVANRFVSKQGAEARRRLSPRQ